MIPENIKQLANKVRNEIYGRDVRESIAKSMEVSGETSNEANERSKDTDARQTDVENRFDDQIAGNTDIDEVIDARRPEGGEAYPTLRKRLDDEHEEVTAQLAHIAINVKKFGAKGDGVTDDTESIQNAIDHVLNNGGGTVFIPNGRYRIAGYIEYGSNMRLLGSGRATVIDGVGGTGEATIRPKKELRGSKEIYDGATDFSLENFAFDSSDLSRQGMYFDNCLNYKVENIWGLNTLVHYLDINNSKNGFFNNLYLHKNEESWGLLQIDSNGGENDGVYINGLIADSSGEQVDEVSMHTPLIHLHRTGGKNIYINNVKSEGVPMFIYKDTNYVVENLNVTNVELDDVYYPIYFYPSSITSKNVIFNNFNIKSEEVVSVFRMSSVEGWRFDNIDIDVATSKEDLIDNRSAHQTEIGRVFVSERYDKKNDDPLYFYKQTSNVKGTEVITPYSGTWKPEVFGNDTKEQSTTYFGRGGTYCIIGNTIHFQGLLGTRSLSSHKGQIRLSGLPKQIYSELGSVDIITNEPVATVSVQKGFNSKYSINMLGISATNQFRFIDVADTSRYRVISDLSDDDYILHISFNGSYRIRGL